MNNDKLNKILLGVIAALVLIIIVGLIVGLSLKGKKSPTTENYNSISNVKPPVNTADVAYYELGTLRITPETNNKEISNTEEVSEQKENVVMVVSPWLAYVPGDTEFYEELARKERELKSYFISYFSLRTKDQINALTEDNVIKELVQQINSKLSLGKINNIYFTDYIFIE